MYGLSGTDVDMKRRLGVGDVCLPAPQTSPKSLYYHGCQGNAAD